MNLIDLYIQEVTRRLPEKSRKDIALELRSTIEDSLPDDYTEEEVKAVLRKLGKPEVLANGYLDRPTHLIGPQFYGVYVQLLKLVMPIAATVGLIVFFVEKMMTIPADQAVLNVILASIGGGIVRVLSVAVQTFFWFTAVFAIMERVNFKNNKPLGPLFKDWDPDDLKKIPSVSKEKAIPMFELFWRLFWTAIWVTVYFNAANLVGVYEKGENGLVFVTPSLNQAVLNSYWLLIVIAVAMEIALSLYKWTIKQWTTKLAIVNTTFQLISSILFIKIFSDPNLFTPLFNSFLSDLFPSIDNPVAWFVRGIIAIFVIFAALDAFTGFKKANLPVVKGDAKRL